MRGTFFGIEIGKTGLSTAQFGLDTTGHNIANVDTAGYTRQRIVSTAYDPFSTIGRFAPVPGQAMVGGGVRVQILDQIRSAYLDRRFRTESTNHAYWEARTQSLSYIESFFDSVNEKTSINYSMAEFFKSMSILAEDPISGAPRTLMQTTAMDLVQQLNMIYDGLIDLQTSENRAIKTQANDINMIAKDIAELNKQIYVFEVTGMIANDLRDKRNLLVDKLTEYIDIEYEEYPDPNNPQFGMFKIMVAGRELVNHDRTTEIGVWPSVTTGSEEEPMYQVCWKYPIGETQPGYDPNDPYEYELLNWSLIEGGSLKGHLDVRDGNEMRIVSALSNPQNGMPNADGVYENATAGEYEYVLTNDSRYRGIPYYIEMINDLARALVSEINAVHRQGWSDNPLGSKTGINFFKEDPADVTWTDASGAEYRWDADAGTWREWDDVSEDWAAGGNFITRDPDTGAYIDQDGESVGYYDGIYDPANPPAVSGFVRTLDLSKITAKNIDLSDEIKASAFNIACSSEPISRAGGSVPGVEEPGTDPGDDDPLLNQRHNNENIKAIYALFSRSDIVVNRPVLDLNGNPVLDGEGNVMMKRVDIGSFDDYGTVIRFDLGNTLHSAKQTGETSRILRLAAENQRTSVAGVSLDEEMVGLVKYQHAFNGASRVITAMDDALDRLINGTGRVGL